MIKITQPSNLISAVTGCTGQMIWNPTFASQRTAKFTQAQKYIDSEVLRLSDPLIPKQTGKLIQSGTTGTVIGSGNVQYLCVYAAYQYYNTSLDHSSNKNPKGGAQWFERMKASNAKSILAGAQQMAS